MKQAFAKANAQSSGLTRGPRAASAGLFLIEVMDCRDKPGNDEERDEH
jgi:hypothetical protein